MDVDAKKPLSNGPVRSVRADRRRQDGRLSAATINGVTQASFTPPLVAIGVKTDSQTRALIDESKAFVLNLICDV